MNTETTDEHPDFTYGDLAEAWSYDRRGNSKGTNSFKAFLAWAELGKRNTTAVLDMQDEDTIAIVTATPFGKLLTAARRRVDPKPRPAVTRIVVKFVPDFSSLLVDYRWQFDHIVCQDASSGDWIVTITPLDKSGRRRTPYARMANMKDLMVEGGTSQPLRPLAEVLREKGTDFEAEATRTRMRGYQR